MSDLVLEVRQTKEFSAWLRRLRDANAVARIRRMEEGNPGDTRSVGKGVMEMRIAWLSRLLFASRNADCDPAVRRRQAHTATGYRAGSDSRGDIVMRKTTRFVAADYLDSEERQVAYISAALET